ncbi:hypothetical protein E3T55_01355 [Cryobacterium frigoriphilum]|uniref:Uncharacterized protein n=1 Tax=Cryobacterium frigoriphilum TaxID=1259150 RepID=A0A4V3IS59_9MICO|nr:hypothetical protein [Cryobacterium frigoriphilum]TFD55334.1 hypothetical protein E3T55_01355 [Cryobacterium frigoriphilum]
MPGCRLAPRLAAASDEWNDQAELVNVVAYPSQNRLHVDMRIDHDGPRTRVDPRPDLAFAHQEVSKELFIVEMQGINSDLFTILANWEDRTPVIVAALTKPSAGSPTGSSAIRLDSNAWIIPSRSD